MKCKKHSGRRAELNRIRSLSPLAKVRRERSTLILALDPPSLRLQAYLRGAIHH